MRQGDFEAKHQAEWAALEAWLDRRARPQRRDRMHDGEGLLGDLDFPAAYRRACQQLAVAQRRGYSATLIARLDEIAHRGHLVLYVPRRPQLARAIAFVAAGFPRLVRREWRAMLVSAFLLFVPMVAFIVLLQHRPELVHTLFEPHEIAKFEEMYDPGNDKLGRTDGTNLMMFGHYVMNNVSIGFRTFASGLLAGVGPVFVLLMNGTMIGGVAGHLTAIGYGGPFWRFVVGHSAPELVAIVIAGGAGLQLGMALIAPGRRSRGRALVEAGAVGARLALGALAMLLFAALIEAYWSSIASMPDALRFGVGGFLWLAVLLWLGFGGRARPETD